MTKSDIQSKEQLMIIALQQRIGEIVASYEAQIASLRADLTILSRIEEKASGNIPSLE